MLIRLADNPVDWQVSKVGGKGGKDDGREEIVSDGGWKNHNGRYLRYLRETFLAKNQSSAFKDCPSDDCFPEPSQFIAMNKNNLAQSSTQY